MAEQEIGDVTKRFAEAYNRGDIAAAVEFYCRVVGFGKGLSEMLL